MDELHTGKVVPIEMDAHGTDSSHDRVTSTKVNFNSWVLRVFERTSSQMPGRYSIVIIDSGIKWCGNERPRLLEHSSTMSLKNTELVFLRASGKVQRTIRGGRSRWINEIPSR